MVSRRCGGGNKKRALGGPSCAIAGSCGGQPRSVDGAPSTRMIVRIVCGSRFEFCERTVGEAGRGGQRGNSSELTPRRQHAKPSAWCSRSRGEPYGALIARRPEDPLDPRAVAHADLDMRLAWTRPRGNARPPSTKTRARSRRAGGRRGPGLVDEVQDRAIELPEQEGRARGGCVGSSAPASPITRR